MRGVFVDTGGWLSLILENDQRHEPAVAYFEKLRHKKMPLITSDYVLAETYTRLRAEAALEVTVTARELFAEAQRLNLLHLEWVNQKIAKTAWGLFIKHEGLSFTGATSLAICQKLGIIEIFAWGEHFNSSELKVNPS